MASRARRKRCLTSISFRIVSGRRLALRREIVSRPPENILSTATAQPGTDDDHSELQLFESRASLLRSESHHSPGVREAISAYRAKRIYSYQPLALVHARASTDTL